MDNRFTVMCGLKVRYYSLKDQDSIERIVRFDPLAVTRRGEVIFQWAAVESELDKLGLRDQEIDGAVEYVKDIYVKTNDYLCTAKPEYVVRCTGLKDKKNKLIYEGDIVKETFGDTGTYKVIYSDSMASFVFANLNSDEYDYDLSENIELTLNDLEVVGNIYENSNLLGDKNVK